MGVTELADRFRQEAYTGANRCTPCTVVNVVLAAAGAGLVWVLVAPSVGVLAFVVGCLAIYVRGYLVPGTPELTKRYFPPWLLRAFGKEPVATTTVSDAATADGEADGPLGVLAAAGVLHDGEEPPRLTSSFAATWQDRTAARLADTPTAEMVADAFGATEASRMSDTSFVLDGTQTVRWSSGAALAADLAGAALLADRLAAWAEYDVDRRRRTLRALRLSLSHCPACGAGLSPETDRVDPCCQKPHLVVESVCAACDTAVADAAVVDTGDIDSVPAALLRG